MVGMSRYESLEDPLVPDETSCWRGTETPVLQCGHLPFLPARSSFTFSFWPQLGQANEIITKILMGCVETKIEC
jgi:hypothetical protein